MTIPKFMQIVKRTMSSNTNSKFPIKLCEIELDQIIEVAGIIVEKMGQITTIGINRPEKRNCVNIETSKLLKNAIESFENDDNAVAGVLYGTGGNFCAGFDLKELANYDQADTELMMNESTMVVKCEKVFYCK